MEQDSPFELPRVRLDEITGALSPPRKRIENEANLNFFLTSRAYHEIKLWILQLTRSCFPRVQADGIVLASRLDVEPTSGRAVIAVQNVLHTLNGLVDETPPESGPRRFGNVAFRKWYARVEEMLDSVLEPLVASITDHKDAILAELRVYLLGGLGSAQRLDYGTGHELSYLAFLGSLWKCGFFQHGEEWSIVAGTLQPYLLLVRRLIKTYTLEPAGSHGVWGLDDHSFIPYILGSAQLAKPISSDDAPTPVEGSLDGVPSPASVTELRIVQEQRPANFYFAAIGFILDVKTGPFFEHSPYLYNISGIKDGWGKINKGMLKMYDAEVLAKFPVVQHFPFGNLWRWERHPGAITPMAASDIKHQPIASIQSLSAPGQTTSAPGQSTKAPWAISPALPPPGSARVPGRRP